MDFKEALFRIWTGFIWLTLVTELNYFEHGMNLPVPSKADNFLTS
jgi:hypothetical protein